MDKFKNINPNEFTLTAFIIGYILCQNLNTNEQNSLGNWFELLGQVLETTAAQNQLLQNNSNKTTNNVNIDTIKTAVDIMNKNLNN